MWLRAGITAGVTIHTMLTHYNNIILHLIQQISLVIPGYCHQDWEAEVASIRQVMQENAQ